MKDNVLTRAINYIQECVKREFPTTSRGFKTEQPYSLSVVTRRQYIASLAPEKQQLTKKQLEDISDAAKVVSKDMLGNYPDHGREYKLPQYVWDKAYNIAMK